jgi:EAL domain-containing protein (putative c-di-GMP-specific phosphodiesterase class I)
MEVVAEGVEKESQLAFLRTQHCDNVQGYLLGRPVSAADFTRLLG